ncbi:nitrogen fixation protein FixH [Amorphus suaedae]
MTTASADTATGFRLTGRKVFLGLVGFFGIITVANVVLIWLAVGTFPGVVTNSAYQAGREYPELLEAARLQRDLGWEMDESVSAGGPTDPVAIRLDANDRDGAPLSGLSVTATLASPTHTGLDRQVSLSEGEVGLYGGLADPLPAGQYDLTIDAQAGNGATFRSVNRIVITGNGQVR